MEYSPEFVRQVLAAHVVELAAVRIRNAELEQRILDLERRLEREEPPVTEGATHA